VKKHSGEQTRQNLLDFGENLSDCGQTVVEPSDYLFLTFRRPRRLNLQI
jgi:hypothetical protein